MPTDVIIEPGSGQIYWNDSAGSTQSISIKGDAQNTISVVGYSGAFSPGSSAGGTFVIASFNDNSGTSAFVPGTTNYDLGSTTYRWSVYGYTGNFSSDVVISSSTQSTSVTSGALRVNGGVGISGRMYFNTAAMGTTGIASPPTFAFIGSTGDPIYLQVLEDNSIAFEGSQGQLFSITPNLSTGYIYSVNDITGIPLLRANANANVTANEFGGNFGIGVTNPGYKLHVVGSVGFTSVTASTSPTTGTLVVSGGVGIGQTLNIGGRLNLWNSANTNFTSFVSTATGNTVYNLPATTPATGSSVLQSDSVGNLSWVGFVANSAATATTAQNINSVVASTSGTHFILFSPVNGGSGIAVSSDSGFTVNPATNVITANTFSGNISATGTTSGFVGVTDATSTTSTTTGALVVTGGVGIGQSAIIGGRVGIGSDLLNAGLTVQTPSTSLSGIAIRGTTSQTADVFAAYSSTGTTSFSVSAGGRARLTGLDGIWTSKISQNIFDVSDNRVNWNLSTWQYSNIYWVTAGANIAQASGQLQIYNSGTTSVTGVGVVATGWDTGGATRVFGIVSPSGTERTYFKGYGNLVINPNNPNGLHAAWNTMDLITLDISGTATTYSGNIIKGSVEGTERFSVGPFGNTRITVGTATTATGFIVKAVASQTGNLIETQSSAGATNFYITPAGNVNVSSTTPSISSSTGALVVSGGVGIGQTLNIGNELKVQGTSASTSTTTGALVVSGGVGIAQTAFIGGNVNILGSTASTYMANGALTVAGGVGISGQLSFNRAAMGYTGIASNPTMAFIGTTGSPITLTVLSDNGLQFEGTSGKLFGINNNLSTGWIFNVGDISGLPLIRANADGTVAMGEFAGNIGIGMSNPAYKLHVIGSVGFTSVTASTNPTTGTLVVSGGAGIGQSLNVGGRLHLWNAANTNFTAFLSAASANHTYTLPANVPSTGTSVLQADTSGILSWVGFSANSASIATTAQNLNTVAATTSATHYLLFSPVNGASGVAVSSDTELSYNPSTNVLSASVFSGNISATAVTSTNFFGTLTGNVTGNVTGTSTTSQNVNTVAATTSASHYLTFSPVNGASGVALSSDANLTFNPSTNVLTTDIFSGNASGTAATYTNFFGTHVGPVTGNVTGTATTSQNINLAAGANNSNHSVVFSLNASGSGVALSSDAGLQYNPSTNVLTADVFSGNVSATAVTATNFFGTFQGSSATAITSQNINTTSAATSASHYILFSPVNATTSGVAVSSDASLQFNPATNVLTVDVFSGNLSATAATATNFFGTHVGPVTGNVTGTATTSQNVNTVAATTSATHYLTFSPVNGASGVALSSDANLTFNPSTNVLTTDVFSGNVSATAVTSTNFFGTLTGNVTGNLTGTATTAQNVNLAAGANASNHSVVFSLNATGTGIALSSDAGLQYNPSTNVLTADVFSGNASGTAATYTNFYGTHVGAVTGNVTGNVTGTATTSQNINTTTATTAGAHYLLFSPVNATASGVAVSSDAQLQFNPGTNVLTADVFSGNVSATAVTSTNFFGTLTGNVTGVATTAQSINLAAGANNSNHSVVFSLNATGTGIALSSDAGLQYNPSTNVLTADVFSGNVTGTAITATNFFGTFQGSAATAVTAQNVNVNATTINSTHFITFTPASSGSGLANSTDTDLTYNPGSNVLTAGVFSGNASGTAATYTNFFGTHVGPVTGNVTGNVTGTATTSQNINTTSATTAGAHYILFSPVNATASGVAVSSDSTLQFNPGTNVLTTDVFSGNLSATAATATNFFGTLVGNSSTATTAANMNVVAASTNSAHYITFSPASSGSGLATSADADLAYNPSTNVLTAGVFSGNLSATAATATNFFGTLVGNSSTATTATNVNLAAGANASNHSIVFSLNATGSGVALSSDAELQYNPSTNALSVGTGNITANTVRIGNTANTIDTSSGNLTLDSTGGQINLNDNVVVQGNLTVQGTTLTVDSTVSTFVDPVVVLGSGVGGTHSTTDNNQDRGIEFRYSNSGTAVTGFFGFQDTDFKFKYIPNATLSGTNVYSGTVGVIVANIEGNVSGAAVTATNFYGTLVGNSSTATTSRNVNTVSANTSANHFILFSPVDGGSGVAVSSDSGFTINPATNVVTAATFAGNLSATAATSTNFFGALTGNVTGTATTSQNVNTVSATTSASHFLLFSPVNGASGVAVSSDTQLTYNPATDVLSATTFSGNVSATAVTATNFFGTLVGNTATATTSQNINTTTAATASAHYILFSPVNATASGVAVSSDSTLQFNPGTNVLTTDVFSGNLSATAATATNFFGTHVGPVTGNVTGTATTSQNINTTAATTAGVHYLLFSPVNATASGVAVSSDSTLQFNPGTNVLTTDIFSGNLSATAATATNFFGTLTGNVTGNLTGTATTAQNVNVVAATTAASHFITFSPASSGSGLATSADTQLTYNPATDVLSAVTFSGNVTGTAITATNFFGALTGNVTGTATTATNINLAAGANNSNHSVIFSLNATGTGVGLSSDAGLQYNPSTNVLTADVFSGNFTGTAATATNFFGTHVGPVTGNVTGTATTSQNINTVSATTSASHFVLFSPVNGASGVAVSSDTQLTYNPNTDILSATTFSGALTGTATTAQNVNVVAATTAATHFVTFSPASSGSGLATSADTQLTYNPATDVLSATTFSGNVTGTAITATNFFGTLVGSVGTATTSQNINTTAATTAGVHYLLFSPVNATASGVAVSSDSTLQFNPGTNVLTTDVFSGNLSATAATATNFFGTHVGPVTGNVTGNLTGTATTSQNVNTVSATTSASHFLLFSPVNGASGVALSSDTQLTYNPATDVLSASTFSGNLSATAATATNFFGTLTGNVTGNLTGTATTAQNINVNSTTINATHYITFSPASSGSGLATSTDTDLSYNPGSNVLSAGVFSGNVTGTAVTATNFFGTLTGNVTGTATTAQNINLAAGGNNSNHSVVFSLNATGTGVGLSSDGGLQYNPSTHVLTTDVFSGNFTGTAATATNFFGTLVGNSSTATTSRNVNTVTATTAGAHFITFSPVNGASGVALSSDAQLTYNPATDVLSATTFSGNVTGTAITATNFYGTLIGSVGTATTSQNINTTAATTAGVHYLLFSPVNATASGVAVSSDATLQFNPGTNVLTTDVFSGNLSATAATAANFYGTHIGNVTGTATTAQNVNTVSATTSSVHYITFSPINGASGVALSSDAQLTYNPATDVLSSTTFSGNVTGTAITATNFFGSLTGTATTSQNINTTAATTAGTHYLLFSPVNATASGIAVSSDATLQFNPGTNVLTTDVFSGNLSATAATATNFYGTHIGNVTGTATTAQNVNLATGANNSNHSVIFSLNATGTGVGLSSDAGLQYNPSTNVLTADVFNGNVTGTAITATNFFGTHVGAVTGNVTGTATTSQNVNTVSANTSVVHYITFSPVNGASGVALSSDAQLTYNPATDVLSATTFSGNVTGTAITATNFYGTLVGSVGTATTSQNINTTAATTAGVHYLLFSPVNATASGVAVSSDATLQFNPGTNVLTTDVFSGNLSATAATATNFFGTLTGNVTGTATTAQNINLAAGSNNSNHSVIFSLNATGTGVGLSSDAGLLYNPSTNVLTADVFSGNFTGTAATATNFFGTHVGAVTGNVTGTATTSQNVNTVSATTAGNHFLLFSPVNGASGVAVSSDATLQFNPATNVLTTDVFSGNVSGTAVTATNFFGTLTGNVTGTATSAQNVNVVLATTAATHFITFSPASSGSGLATSADTQLTYNPATDVLSATTFSGNVTGTAITATNFYGTLVGSVGTATTSANINTVAATTAGVHYLTFSPVNGASGVALSSDASLQFNPSTNVLTTDIFSGNLSATATTSGFVRVSDLTPSTSPTTGALIVAGGVGIGGSIFTAPTSKSSISGVSFNNSRAENGFTINATSSFTFNIQDAANNQRLNYHSDSNRTEFTGNNATHEIRLIHSNNSGYTGFKANSSGTVTYTLPAGDGSNGQYLQTNGTGTLSWTTVTGGSGGGSSGVNAGGQYQIAYYASTGSSVDGSSTFTNNTATSTVSITHATSSTATNVGALVVTGGLGLGGNAFIGGTVTITNSTASTTTANGALVVTGGLGVGAQINSASIVTSGNAVFNGNLQFKGTGTFGDNAAADTIAYNARSTTDFNPSTSNSVDLGFNTLVWRNLFANFITGSAVTATNFYGTLAGNVTGTSTTSQNINSVAATTAGAHYILFSPVNGASGVAVSSEATLQFNPGTNVLTTDVFSGNLSATAATATNFYGTHIGNVTGTSTTSQNINTTAATTAGTHYLLFSPVNATASGVAVSSDATLQFNPGTNVLTTDVFSGNLSATAATSGRFAVGNLTYAAANLLAAFQSSVNSYNQVVIQNSNNGASASSDLVVNNDISTDTGAFGTFGMNSSGFTGLGSTNIPNAVYVTAATAELVLGTTTNNRIRFVNENVDTFQITATGSSVYTTTATLSRNSGAFVVAGGAAIGLSLSVGQGIQLYNSTNGNHTGFRAGATSANSVYTLPLAYPSTGSSILQSDTSGTMIWVNAPTGGSATPAGNNTELQYNNAGAFGGATGLTWQAVNNTLQINSNASHTTSTQVGLRLENGLASGGQATRWSPTFEMVGRSGIANVYFSRFAAEVVPQGPATYASALRFKYSQDQGTASYSSNIFSIHSTLGIGIGGSTVSSNFMSYIRAHESQAADIFYKLPLAAPGTGASFLQCDTSGNMSWVNSPGGGSGSPAGSPKQIQFNNNGAFGGAGGFEYITVGGSAVTVSMFSVAGGGYTSGLWVNVLSASSTRIGIGLSNPQYELEINGELSATNKSFVINHPTKPGMKLRYGSLEGPENGVYVRGELNGSNIIEVPDHWIGLVHEDSYTVHLTPIGRYSQLYVEKIENYNVYVADNLMNPIHCYYSVWAERKDIPKLVTEY